MGLRLAEGVSHRVSPAHRRHGARVPFHTYTLVLSPASACCFSRCLQQPLVCGPLITQKCAFSLL